MTRTRRSAWWVLGLAAAVTLGALAWITRMALDLEYAESCARAEAAEQADLRLALWRMDSWLGPLVAAEAARPYFEYLPYVPQERAYTRILQAIEPGEVLSPSPLLTFRSEVLALHFQVDAAGRWTSPQVPTGNLLDLAQETLLEPEEIADGAARLAALALHVDPVELEITLCEGEAGLAALLTESPDSSPQSQESQSQASQSQESQSQESQSRKPQAQRRLAQTDQELARNRAELSQRVKNVHRDWAANAVPPPDRKGYGSQAGARRAGELAVGPLVPLWLEPMDGVPTLAYLRRVVAGDEELLQGVLVDWPRLESTLLAELVDLFGDEAHLIPEGAQAGDPWDTSLATLPARLEVPRAQAPEPPSWSPTRTTLLVVWIATLVVLLAVGLTLQASIAFGERRSRFASAVTHELRTPLTTFRMYSEMLAEGMIPEERRAEYLATLRSESDRLAGLVENVLSYARLEDGRSAVRRRPVAVDELLERTRGDLERRVADARGVLVIDADGASEIVVETDPDAAGQILFNLVDNACKYGAPPVRLSARARDGKVELAVEDAGAGIPPSRKTSIFQPFDRGGRDEADDTPGIGLGLALARGLARDLGGDLELGDSADGARFLLTLPRAPEDHDTRGRRS